MGLRLVLAPKISRWNHARTNQSTTRVAKPYQAPVSSRMWTQNVLTPSRVSKDRTQTGWRFKLSPGQAQAQTAPRRLTWVQGPRYIRAPARQCAQSRLISPQQRGSALLDV